MEVEWTNASIIELIGEYRRHPELWDKRHELFRVPSAKHEAWSALAATFNCDIIDIKKKFNSILASRRREKAKIRAGRRSKWFLYRYLHFLASDGEPDPEPEHTVNNKCGESGGSASEMEACGEGEGEGGGEGVVRVKKEPAGSETVPPVRTWRRLRRTRPPPAPRDTTLVEVARLVRRAEAARKKDECDVFGEYVASSLRKHGERTRAMIKQAINNILFEQEMKRCSAGPSYTVIIEQPEGNPLAAGGGMLSEDDIEH